MKLSNIALKKREIYRGPHTKAQELNKQTGKEHLRAQTKQCIPHAMFRQVNQWPEDSLDTTQAQQPRHCSSSKSPFPEAIGLQEGKANDFTEPKEQQLSEQPLLVILVLETFFFVAQYLDPAASLLSPGHLCPHL